MCGLCVLSVGRGGCPKAFHAQCSSLCRWCVVVLCCGDLAGGNPPWEQRGGSTRGPGAVPPSRQQTIGVPEARAGGVRGRCLVRVVLCGGFRLGC